MRQRLRAVATVETYVGQVVTAGALAQTRIAREQAGGLGHFTGAAFDHKGTTWIIMIMS
jgi:hypothetical protein